MIYHLTDEEMGVAFNRWLGDYIENPGSFTALQESIKTSIKEATEGHEPSYGASCAATLLHYIETPED